jgi:hypothetical protein
MDCGSCQYFQKWKNDKYNSGVCIFYDARTNTDDGHNCKFYKAISYDRNKVKQEFKQILKGFQGVENE